MWFSRGVEMQAGRNWLPVPDGALREQAWRPIATWGRQECQSAGQDKRRADPSSQCSGFAKSARGDQGWGSGEPGVRRREGLEKIWQCSGSESLQDFRIFSVPACPGPTIRKSKTQTVRAAAQSGILLLTLGYHACVGVRCR